MNSYEAYAIVIETQNRDYKYFSHFKGNNVVYSSHCLTHAKLFPSPLGGIIKKTTSKLTAKKIKFEVVTIHRLPF